MTNQNIKELVLKIIKKSKEPIGEKAIRRKLRYMGFDYVGIIMEVDAIIEELKEESKIYQIKRSYMHTENKLKVKNENSNFVQGRVENDEGKEEGQTFHRALRNSVKVLNQNNFDKKEWDKKMEVLLTEWFSAIVNWPDGFQQIKKKEEIWAHIKELQKLL